MTFTPTTHYQPIPINPSISRGARPQASPVRVADPNAGGGVKKLRFGDFWFEVAAERLFRDDVEIPLKPKTSAMLVFFIRNPQRLIAKSELLEAIWGETHISPETLRSTLRELRSVLDDDARMPNFIETVHGRGYRFLLAVEAEGASPVRSPGAAGGEVIRLGVAPDAPTPRVLRQLSQTLHQLSERAESHGLSEALEHCASVLQQAMKAESGPHPAHEVQAMPAARR